MTTYKTDISSGFEIQRKINSDWEDAGFIEGNGTTINHKEYIFTDKINVQSYKGTIIYRLKKIDFDGSYQNSNEIKFEVDFIPKEFILYQNFLNPFNPATAIKYALPFERFVEIIIYNQIGQKVGESDEGGKTRIL